MDVNVFKKFCAEGKILWTAHALERLQERDISVDDLKHCVMHGEIIKKYPDDFPHSSALVAVGKLGQ